MKLNWLAELLSFYKIVSESVSQLVTFVFQGLAEQSSASQKDYKYSSTGEQLFEKRYVSHINQLLKRMSSPCERSTAGWTAPNLWLNSAGCTNHMT